MEEHVVSEQVPIDHYSAVHLAATRAREAGVRCGLGGSRPDQAAAVASELASNLAKYARDGVIYLHPLPAGEGMEILTADHGPGMADVRSCLAEGFTTCGSLGTGLGAVQRISTGFVIRSRVPDGTVASARIAPGAGAATGAGMLVLSADGQDECGDGAAVFDHEDGRTAVVIDGLGHGEAAARATRKGLQTLHEHGEKPLDEIMLVMHRAMRHTRGAAVGLLRLLPGRVQYCAVGNIRLCLAPGREEQRQLDGRPGVVGWNLPTPHIRTATLRRHDLAVLYSDGIEARWTRDPSAFLVGLPAELLAAALTRQHRRHRDDSTVVSLAGL